MAYENVILGIVFLSVGLLSNYGKFGDKIRMQLNWIVSGGLMFLFTGAWEIIFTTGIVLSSITPYVTSIFNILGMLFILIGTIWSVVKLLKI